MARRRSDKFRLSYSNLIAATAVRECDGRSRSPVSKTETFESSNHIPDFFVYQPTIAPEGRHSARKLETVMGLAPSSPNSRRSHFGLSHLCRPSGAWSLCAHHQWLAPLAKLYRPCRGWRTETASNTTFFVV